MCDCDSQIRYYRRAPKNDKKLEARNDYYSLAGVIDVIKTMGSNERISLDGYLGDVALIIIKDSDFNDNRHSVIMDMLGSEEMNLVTVDFRLNGKSIASTYDIHVSELEDVLNDIRNGDSSYLVDESRSLEEVVRNSENRQ